MFGQFYNLHENCFTYDFLHQFTHKPDHLEPGFGDPGKWKFFFFSKEGPFENPPKPTYSLGSFFFGLFKKSPFWKNENKRCLNELRFCEVSQSYKLNRC